MAQSILTHDGFPERRDAALPDPSTGHLLIPKLLTARARAVSGERGATLRWIFLGLFGALFWAFIYFMLFRLLRYFRGVPEIGPLLAGKLLGLILVGFFSILLLSNIITALSSFFLARDLDLLVSAPVDWLKLYLAKLAETLVHSSWMVALMAVPILSAYGYVYHGGVLFVLVALATAIPYLVIPAVLGSAIVFGLREYLSTLVPWWQYVLGGVYVLTILYLPTGLMGIPARLRQGRTASDKKGEAIANLLCDVRRFREHARDCRRKCQRGDRESSCKRNDEKRSGCKRWNTEARETPHHRRECQRDQYRQHHR